MNFEKRHLEQISHIKNTTEICILIWGSGINSEHYEKRLKLKQELKSEFVKAEVFFSEDTDLDKKFDRVNGSYNYMPQHSKQQFQMDACDVCIVLDTSKGPAEEIAFALSNPKNLLKLFILTPERHKGNNSFSSKTREGFPFHSFYTQEEYDKCNLVQRAMAHIFHLIVSRHIT